MRNLSATALEAVLAEETSTIFLTTVEITHPDISEPLRFVDNNEDVTSGGNLYIASAFEFRLPNDVEDNIPKGEIILDNVDRQIIEAVRPLKKAPDITVQVGVLDEQNMTLDIEIGPLDFKLKQVQYNAQIIQGELGYDESFLNQAFPKFTFNPRTSAGIF